MAAAAYKEQLDGIARKLMEEGREKGGRTAGKGGRGNKKTPVAKVPQGFPDRAPASRTKAGKRFGVGEKGVDHASKILKQGDPELAALINAGRVKKSQELTSQGMSTRAIAAELGVDNATVHRDSCSTVASATVEQPDKVKGTDGKSYPAKAGVCSAREADSMIGGRTNSTPDMRAT